MSELISGRTLDAGNGPVLGEEARERYGRLVRETWIGWAREQPNPKPSWLVPWEGLSEPDREVDRRIGEVLAAQARAEERERIERAMQAVFWPSGQLGEFYRQMAGRLVHARNESAP